MVYWILVHLTVPVNLIGSQRKKRRASERESARARASERESLLSTIFQNGGIPRLGTLLLILLLPVTGYSARARALSLSLLLSVDTGWKRWCGYKVAIGASELDFGTSDPFIAAGCPRLGGGV